MATVRATGSGLAPQELQHIRDTLATGRKPKVMFTESAGQIAGQVGQVVKLTDPAVSDEWLVVRFGRDELPFSPTDLAIPPKGGARRPEPKPAPEPAAPEPEFMIERTPVPPARKETVVSSTRQEMSAPAEQHTTDEGAGTTAEPKPGRRVTKAPRPKGPTGLTVTLSYADGEWTVAANQGNKSLAKPYVVKPAEALRMVALVDVPGVHEAVEQIVSAERAEAERQAEKLRAELAEIESRLAELRDAG